MTGFIDLKSIVVPRSVVLEAHEHLRTVGRKGLEGFALWAGQRTSATSFEVRAAVIPAQQGLRSDRGVCVTVNGEELHRINRWLFEHHMTLIAQLHTHPTSAYHSETDNRYPIVTTVGGLSLVVPNFARAPFSLAACAVYRLLPKRGWVELIKAEAAALVRLGT